MKKNLLFVLFAFLLIGCKNKTEVKSSRDAQENISLVGGDCNDPIFDNIEDLETLEDFLN
ncbi:hypothetical protein [Flavobacterium rhizosphaerae]|uniref:Lipoprotein n=1 Tax=Flavobacterium rhizosphaerae TaxID=3163298 RepID=A0ABW8YVB0_9FLAO